MNYIVNNYGEIVPAIGAPGSVARRRQVGLCMNAQDAVDMLHSQWWVVYKETANFVYLRSDAYTITSGVCKRTGAVCTYSNVD